MRKIPPGVGPRCPQVVVLFGATGDLAHRKLLPGLFRLSGIGFIPGCRIIGVSLEDMDAEAFRKVARSALDEFSTRKVTDGDWKQFSECLDYVPLKAGPPALRAAVDKAEKSIGGESRRLHYLSVPPSAALSAVRMLAEAGLVEGSLHHHGETVRHGPEERGGAEREIARGVRRVADLPHRSFPGQGGCAEHSGVSLRQRAVRADMEPQFHRSRADRRAGDPGPGQARLLLRGHGRVSRHGGDPSLPDPRVHRHGGADVARARAHQRGEEQGVSQPGPDSAGGRGARAISRLPPRGGHRPGVRYRDVHRAQVHHRQLALGRRAVLPAHRQAPCRGTDESSRSPSGSRRAACFRRVPASERRDPTI